MNLTPLTPLKTLRYFHRKQDISADKLLIFKKNLLSFLSNLKQTAREGKQETDLRDFLNQSFYKDQYYINKKETADWVIYNGKDASAKVGVIIEVKSTNNAAEMVSLEKPNAKALHELVFYYLRERIDNNNHEIKHLIASNGYEWFVFDEANFDSVVFKPSLVKDYKEWKLSGHDTSHFYKHTAKNYLQKLEKPLECCKIDLRDYEKANDKKLTELYKLLSPEHLLKKAVGNDANKLNTPFYNELLYLIGIEETKASDGNKKVIEQVAESRRQSGSLLENTLTILDRKGCLERMNNLAEYGDTLQEQRYSIALELCITWLNRILFLKLLEGQLVNFHHQDPQFRFLSYEKITDFDEVAELFFEVLAIPTNERTQAVNDKFGVIPYLNSSLFELSELEQDTLSIEDLKDRLEIPYFAQTVLKDDKGKPLKGQAKTLKYLFDFLGAYSFSSTPDQSEHKTLINASVLGLIFEKLNGYKEGSFFTPAFITMFMCRESIRRAVVQKFNEQYAWQCEGFDDLKEQIEHTNKAKRNEYNGLLNSVRICDPAVGSGHFLVSALNEIVTIKAELKLLQHPNGTRLNNVSISIENDELVVFDEDTGEDFDYRLSKANTPISEKQLIQETLFEEKRIIIENCLFGVDINPKSVKICQLRLWIELLKNAYYLPTASGLELQTLPNIDINIKCGNSLVSRLALDFDLKEIFQHGKYSYNTYLTAVKAYKETKNKKAKAELRDFIKSLKKQALAIALKRDDRVVKLKKLKEQLFLTQNNANFGDLFGKITDKKLLENEGKINNQIELLERSITYDSNNVLYHNSLEWRLDFPEVLDHEGNYIGFDVIVGNPPYIKAGEFNDYRSILSLSYPNTFSGTADMYVYFIERGMQILKTNSVISLIIPNKWMRTGYGENLRKWLKTYQFNQLIDFGDLPVFEEATTYPCIVSLTNKPDSSGQFAATNVETLNFASGSLSSYVNENNFLVSIQGFSDQEGWMLSNSETQILLQKIRKIGKPLEEYTSRQVYYGLKTGFNPAFVIDEKAIVDKLIAEDTRSSEVIVPFVEGKDVKRYQQLPVNQYLILFRKGQTREYFVEKAYQKAIFSYQEQELVFNKNELWSHLYKTLIITYEEAFEWLSTTYPAITKHLLPYQEKAMARGDKGEFWWELRACSYYEEFAKPKLIYPNICRRPEFTLDYENFYANQKCFIISKEDKYLLAILNSAVTYFLFRNLLPTLRGDFYEPNYSILKDFPIPISEESVRLELSQKVESILSLKKEHPNADVSQLEAEIDNIVFGLYGLSQEEQEIVLKG